ncbi:hypothetical protein F3Y22_tig00110393pilonHSYRG00234 [Hibiscus syriacus]|uniref:Uncharacterized protein n=1 Tax=Hibiscus syriacus TaxID=106335 RepID=A0A6A3AUC3_HIBSY|nr:hypothetical protein F3Y22_tig00110393pilonHSYRG00234 [Hibiscus syriacus]
MNSDSDEESKLLYLTKWDSQRKKQRKLEKKLLNEDDHAVHLSIPMIGSAKLTERICKALEAYDNEPPSSVQKDMFHGGINVLSLFSGINDAEVAFYCLGILLKIDVQELNDDRLEQLMSSFVEFDLVQSSEGHNEYHLDKENDQHRRSSNNVSRLEPTSRYNQSAGSDLFMAL